MKTTPVCTPCGVIDLPVDGTPVRTGPKALRRRYGRSTGAGGRWLIVEPLAKAQVMGGAYLRSEDGRFVIFAIRYRKGDKGFKRYAIWYSTVEYLDGNTYRTGGANRTLYEGSGLESAKKVVP